MLKEDNEAFDYFWEYKCGVNSEDCGKDDIRIVWQEACEYKRDEYSSIMQAMTQTSQNNFKLQAENAKLRECVEYILSYKSDEYLSMSKGSIFDVARQVLKELGEK